MRKIDLQEISYRLGGFVKCPPNMQLRKFPDLLRRKFKVRVPTEVVLQNNPVWLHSRALGAYNHIDDAVGLHWRWRYEAEETLHRTTTHELIHWTARRVGRYAWLGVEDFTATPDAVCREEFVANLGTCLIMGTSDQELMSMKCNLSGAPQGWLEDNIEKCYEKALEAAQYLERIESWSVR